MVMRRCSKEALQDMVERVLLYAEVRTIAPEQHAETRTQGRQRSHDTNLDAAEPVSIQYQKSLMCLESKR